MKFQLRGVSVKYVKKKTKTEYKKNLRMHSTNQTSEFPCTTKNLTYFCLIRFDWGGKFIQLQYQRSTIDGDSGTRP